MIDVEHPAHEKTLRADPAKIGGALKVLIEPGSVVELRALGVPSGRYANTISGYFDNLDAMALEAARLSDVGAVGVYFTLNPLKPSLLARSANRARIAGRDVPSAGDHDVTGRRWLLIDSDPNRPSGISASDEEKAAAFQRTRQVSTALRDAGWPHPIAADSGNGFHLLYRIDLPAEDGGLIQKVLEALAFRYGDDVVKIDTAVHNPARIDKLYGTFARKGDSTDDRPHRLSRITQVPASLEVVTEEKLRAVAAWRPPPDPKPNGGHSSRDFDLEQWIASHGIEVRGPYSWQGGRKWILPRCPWNQSHDNSASYIVQHASGAIAAGCHHDGCQGKGWPELRLLFEPDAYDGRDDRREEPASIVWPPFRLLTAPLAPVPQMPTELIPEPFRRWLGDAAERLQVPVEMLAAPAVVALGSVTGRGIGILPKRCDDWLVVPNLWGMIVGRPGVLKSPVVRESMRFVNRLAAEASRKFAVETEVVVLEQEIIEMKIAELKKRNTKPKANPEEARDELKALLQEKRRAVTTERRYVTQDGTVEKIGALLNENPRGILVLRDELAGWLRTLDKPGREGDREFYLEAWNGVGRYTFHRIGRGSIHIESLTLSIFGTIQPSKLRAYIAEAVNEGCGDDGLLQRFQIVVWPDVSGEWENVDRFPETEARRRAFRIFETIDSLDPIALGIAKGEDDEIPAIRFGNEAQELFDDWRGDLERRIRSADLAAYPAYEAHISKYRSLMPSLALLFHLVEAVVGATFGTFGTVSLRAAKQAAAWVDFLDAHARRVYGVELEPGVTPAHALAEKIRIGAIRDGDKIQDLVRHHWQGLKTAGVADAGLTILAEHGWLRVVGNSSGGRPERVINLRPGLEELVG